MKNYGRLFLVDGDSFIYKALSGIHRLGEGDKVLIFVAAEELRQRLKKKGYVRSNVNVIMVHPEKEAVDNRIRGFLGNMVNREDRGQIFVISRDHGYCKRMDYYRKKYGIPAYERGLKPLSRIRAADLRQNGFEYSVAFFRWLVHHWDIRPRERHHTSASCRITAFYDGSVIRYAAQCCNLELLFRIYKGKITVRRPGGRGGSVMRERGFSARCWAGSPGRLSARIASSVIIFCF